MLQKPMYQIDVDCLDPEEKKKRIEGKALLMEKQRPTMNKPLEIEGNVPCTECGGELECIAGSTNLYKCDDCGRTWEHVGTRGKNHVWVCIFEPQD